MAVTEGLITFKSDTAYVNVLVSDTTVIPQEFKERKIEVGLSDGINIEVLSGLDWNDLLKGELKKEDKKKKKEIED